MIPEPFGQVVIEGMAAGLPVVAVASGGPAEVIADETTGLLYPSGDVHALARIMRRLANDSALRGRLGQAARLRARDFVPEVIAPQVLDVYRSLLAKKPVAASLELFQEGREETVQAAEREGDQREGLVRSAQGRK